MAKSTIDVNSIIQEVASEFNEKSTSTKEPLMENNMSHALSAADMQKENAVNRDQLNMYNQMLGGLDDMNKEEYVKAGSAANNAIASGLGALCICKKLRAAAK